MQRIAIFVSLVLGACGGTSAPVEAPHRAIGARTSPDMSIEEARSIVARFEEGQARATPAGPLDHPTTLDDVRAIVRTDQVDLFPAAIERVAGEEGTEARALHAQLELSWGEAQLIVAHVLGTATGELRRAAGDDPEYRRSIADAEELALALELVANEHVERGSALAGELLIDDPDHYLGYRVAADSYRLRHQWSRFDAEVARLRSLRPTSTGLKFLLGAAAIEREGDEDAAERLLREALSEDPEFTRAQVQLLFAQDSLPEMNRELARLERMNENHQVVTWAGPVIRLAWDDARRRQARAAQVRDHAVP
jgi:hypothetical protein